MSTTATTSDSSTTATLPVGPNKASDTSSTSPGANPFAFARSKHTRRLSNYMVQDRMEDEYDKTILHRKLFPVNIRLMNANLAYKNLIEDILVYMEEVLTWDRYEDYGRPKGISGANIGIPFNIIAIRNPVDENSDDVEFFLNPVIIARSLIKEVVQSNCGSLRLEKPLSVERHVWIDIEYYNEHGIKQKRIQVDRKAGGYTIQHEIEHNLGILITDKVLL
jgi:peptide deformylase